MKLEQILSLRYPLPEKSLDKLHRCMSEITLPKGFHILEINKVEKDIFFIKQGIVRAFTYVDGKEITFWIGKEGATIVSMKGYVNDEAGYETMELMEDSVLYVLKRKKLQELFLEDLHIANWGRRYAEMELLETEQRLISMLSAIASERYRQLVEMDPELLQRLPLGSIASYLGIQFSFCNHFAVSLHIITPQSSISVPNASTHAQGDWLLPTLSLLCVAMQNDIPRV